MTALSEVRKNKNYDLCKIKLQFHFNFIGGFQFSEHTFIVGNKKIDERVPLDPPLLRAFP
jgi:hypothetical protein